MAIAAGEVARVTIRGRIHSQKTINVLHFKCANAGTDAILTALLTAVIACVVELLTHQSSEYQFEGATATKLNGTFDEITDASASANGGVITDALPSFVAGVIRFTTLIHGRTGRGRMYIPGFPEAIHEDSIFTDADTHLGLFLLCLLNKFKLNGGTDPNWKLCVMSRKFLQANPGNFTAACHEVVGGSVNNQVCTMRSRKLGHGD